MTVRPLLNEYQVIILRTVKENAQVMKSKLYSGLTEQKYFEELLKMGLLKELKHGIYNKKTITITDSGMTALTLAEELIAVMNRSEFESDP